METIVFLVILLIVLIIIWLIAVNLTNNGIEEDGYTTYALCPCGRIRYAPFGSKFHIHEACCPICGGKKADMDIVIGRYVAQGKTWYSVGKKTFQLKEKKND